MKKLCLLPVLLLLFAPVIFSQETGVFPPRAILNAAYAGDVEMVKLILKTNPDKDVRDGLGGTALHVAVLQNNLEILKLLLDNGFDKNAAAKNGYTPLHYCVWINNVEAAKILVSYNADRDIKDNNGQTPMQMATKDAKRDILLVLARR